MKRWMVCLLILVLLLAGAAIATAEDLPLSVGCMPGYSVDTVYLTEDGVITEATPMVDCCCFQTYDTGCTDLMVDGADDGGIYRIRISGIAEDGEEFAWCTSFVGNTETGFYLRDLAIANESGTYGPYLMEVFGNGESLKILAVFEVDASNYDGSNGPGIVMQGGIQEMAFVEIEPVIPIEIQSPVAGARMCGAPGSVLSVVAGFTQEKTAVATLTETSTGRVLASCEGGMMLGGYDGWTFREMNLTIDEAFEDTGCELTVSDGNVRKTIPIMLIDENSLADEGALSVSVMQENGGSVGLEGGKESVQTIELMSNGVALFEAQGGTGVYHLKMTGSDLNGNPLTATANWSRGTGNNAQFMIATLAGTYGPFDLEVVSGNQKVECRVEFAMAADCMDAYYGILANHSFPEHAAFVNFDMEYEPPIVIGTPMDGSVMYGCPEYVFPVEVRTNGAYGMMSVTLIDCSTGEFIETQTHEVEYYTDNNFTFRLPEGYEFADGAPFRMEVVVDGKTCVSEFTLALEEDSGL